MISHSFKNISRGGAVILAAISSLLLSSCSRNDTTPPFLAQVGDRRLTADDLQKEIDRRKQVRRSAVDPETVLQEMVQYEADLLRARQAGLMEDPQIQRQIGLLLISKVKERQLSSDLESVQVSTNEAQANYEQELSKYTEPAKVRLALLYLPAGPKASEAKRTEVRERMEEARREMVANPPNSSRGGRGVSASGFGPLALQFSDEQTSRYRGGDIGWLETGKFEYRWPRPVLETAYGLEKDQISDLIETEEGFYLVMKTDERDLSVTPFAQVEATIRHSLLLQKRREMEQAFRQESIQLAGARIDEKALAVFNERSAPTEIAQYRADEPPAFPLTAETTKTQ